MIMYLMYVEKIADYESYMFGEQYFKDFSNPEKVTVMAYIYGEELLQRCNTLQEAHNDNNTNQLTQKDIDNIISELKSIKPHYDYLAPYIKLA